MKCAFKFAFIMAVFCFIGMAGCEDRSQSIEVRLYKADLYDSRGEVDEAIAVLTNLVNDLTEKISQTSRTSEFQKLDLSTIHYERGVLYEKKNQFANAIADYTKAIEFDNQALRAYNDRAVLYTRQGDYPLAIADLDSVIQIDPENSLAFANRGFAFFKLQQFKKAKADYEQSIALNPESARTYFLRGELRMSQEEWNRAIEDFSVAINRGNRYADAYLARGSAYAQKGETKSSRSDYARAKEIDPEIKLPISLTQ